MGKNNGETRVLDPRALKSQMHRHYLPFLDWLRRVLVAGLLFTVSTHRCGHELKTRLSVEG